MKVYTKGGDRGETSLLNGARVSKTDERIELLGMIDELNSHLGLVKALEKSSEKEMLEQIQRTLMQLMAGVASENSGQYAISKDQTFMLEQEIDRMETLFQRPKKFVLYGGCELSARLDVARAVARRAERQLYRVAEEHSTDEEAKKYLNRLSDYLYLSARLADEKAKAEQVEKICREVVLQVMEKIEKDSE